MSRSDLTTAPWFRLSALSGVYLAWGVIASLNDLLIPYLKDEYGLDFSGALRIQLVFYAAYFFLSIPCGLLARRYGYRNGILAGLTTAIGGCLLMLFASQAGSYGIVLGAIFVLASGITMLQVSANPFATSLGPERTAPSRLTLVQSFHSLGTTIGPALGAILIFSWGVSAVGADASPGAAIWRPYALLAVVLAALGLLFLRIGADRQPDTGAPAGFNLLPLFRSNRRLLPGTLGIFCYVGAEIAIASLLVNYLVRPEITGLDYAAAGKLVSVYWGLALTGRFVGVVLLRRFRPDRMLGLYAAAAIVLAGLSIASSGWLAAGSILAVGFFNSIMFPTIFALVLRGSPPAERAGASGVLCLGIVGGAVVSQAQGMLADLTGIQWSFVVPLICYVYVAVLAATLLKPEPENHPGNRPCEAS
jgi:FHS family L-fucose permease-like MFS transporter